VSANGNGVATIESVADILEREVKAVIEEWVVRVEQEPDLTCIPMNFEDLPLAKIQTAFEMKNMWRGL
jgi:hypothetical protein